MECDDRQDQDWLQEQRTVEDDVVSEFGQKQICRMRFQPFLHFRTRSVKRTDRPLNSQSQRMLAKCTEVIRSSVFTKLFLGSASQKTMKLGSSPRLQPVAVTPPSGQLYNGFRCYTGYI